MVALPAATPVTVPAASTVAIAVLLLLQVPPLTVSARPVERPRHTVVAPVTAPAPVSGLTVAVAVATDDPQLPEMV